MIASQYGYTFEEFGKMTYGQIKICLDHIGRRKYNEQVFLARLQGNNEAEFMEKEIEKTQEEDDKIESDIMKMTEAAVKRKQEELNRKKGK